jgi:DNA sulfur modification protein DndB
MLQLEGDILNTKDIPMALRPGDPRRSFPAARGIQARKEAYIAFLKYSEAIQVFKLDYLELPVEERSQRTPKQKHAQEIADYVVNDFEDHVIPPLVASINGEVEFESPSEDFFRCGMLHIAADAQLVLIDGQHRRLAFEKLLAIAQTASIPELRDEMIPVYLILDTGLRRNQKAYAAITSNAKNMETSLEVLYKDTPKNNFTMEVVKEVEFLKLWTEFERGTVIKSSPKLLTLRWIYKVHEQIRPGKTHAEDKAFCIAFWNALVANIPQWSEIASKQIEPKEVREGFMCGQAVFLDAIALVGKSLSAKTPDELTAFFKPLKDIDWRKTNQDWHGRTLEVAPKDFKVLTGGENVRRFSIYLKVKLGFPVKAFSKDEVELENTYSNLLKPRTKKS